MKINLNKLLIQKSINRKDFAMLMNISKSSIDKYCNDEREMSFDNLIKASKILNVSIDEILNNKTNNITDSDIKDINKKLEEIKILLNKKIIDQNL